ncbi:MAG TPA: tetratricopeptide repeat protein [Vicinamibacteria bacterium]
MKPQAGTDLNAAQVRARAYAEERAGRTWQAIALLQESVERGPDDWTNIRMLADLLSRTGRRADANEHYRRLAQNCELDGLHAQAIAAWKRILANEPDSAGVQLKLGELYALTGLRADARGHYEAALAAFRKAGRAREVAQVEARLAVLDHPDGTGAAPPLSLEQAAGQEEASAPGLAREGLAQARLFRRYGLGVQARARLDAVLARFPDHLEARRELHALLLETGPAEDAREQERLLAGLEARGSEPAAPPPSPARPAPPVPPLAPVPPVPPVPPTPGAARTGEPPAASRPPADAGRQIGLDDYESRYDLGVAYREMGLLDEAIAELQLAAADPGRLAACASLLAECYAELGQAARSLKWLEKGLAVPGLPAERRRDLRYRLATAFEASGAAPRALSLYRELEGEDPGFRDVAARVRTLAERVDPGPSRRRGPG